LFQNLSFPFSHNQPGGSLQEVTVSLKDLVHCWWNNCVEKELVLEDIFEDILEHYKDRMLPPEEPKERADISNGFDGILEVI